jgi:hypothetical protein
MTVVRLNEPAGGREATRGKSLSHESGGILPLMLLAGQR